MSVKTKVRRVWSLPEALVHALLVQLRTEALERREGRLELGGRRVLVALPAEREPEQHPRVRRLVRSTNLCQSSRARLRQAAAPSASPSASLICPEAKWTVASNAGARRSPIVYESTMPSSSSIAARAVFRSPAAIAISTCAGKRRRRESGSCGVLERARDRRDGAVDLALGETQEREAGLRSPSQLVGFRVRLHRGGEVAAAAADLTDLVVAAGRDVAVEVVELLARCDRLLLRLGPLASDPHDLRAMDATCAGEARDLEAVAPTVRDLGPFGRPAVVAEVLTGADRDAVDDPGRERPQLAAHGRGSCLVEERESFLDVARLDERSALSDERQRVRVAVAEAETELGSAVELRDRSRAGHPRRRVR